MSTPRTPLAVILVVAVAALVGWLGAGRMAGGAIDPAAFLAEHVEHQLAKDWAGARAQADLARQRFASAGDTRGEAACWTLIGGAEFALGAQEQGFAAFERALDLLAGVDPLGYAAVARLTARLELGLGRHAPAEGRLRAALAALERSRETGSAIDRDWFAVYHSFLQLPVEWGVAGEVEREKTLDAARAAVLDSLGEVLFWRGRLDEAEAVLTEALKFSEAAGGLVDANAHIHLGLVLQRRGEPEAATARFTRAFTAMAGGECRQPRGDEQRRLCFFVIERLADVATRAGRYEQALAWTDRGLDLFGRLGDAAYQARLLVERSWTLLTAGDVAAARAALEEASDLASGAGDAITHARVLRALAVQSLEQGKVEEAADYLARPNEAPEPDRCIEVQSALARATSYSDLGAHELARNAVTEAMNLAKESYCPEGESLSKVFADFLNARDASSLTAVRETLRQLGVALARPELTHLDYDPRIFTALEWLARGKSPARARRVLQSVVRSSVERREPAAEARARLLLGFANLREGRREAARAQWMAALEIFRRLDLKGQESLALTKLSELAWRTGDRAGAIEQARQAVGALEATLSDIRLDEHLAFYLGERATPYENLVEMLVETDQAREAFAYAERSRARALLRLLEGSRPRVDVAAQPALVAKAEALRVRTLDLERRLWETRDQASAAGLRRAIEAVQREHENVLLGLKLASRAAATPSEPLTAAEVQRLLPPDVTLLSFFVTASRTLVWIVGPERFDLLTLDLGREALAVQVERYRREIADRQQRATASRSRGIRLVCAESEPSERTASDELFARLAVPLAPYLRTSRLLVVPHDSLHLLPFAALRDPDTGRYLVEDFELSYTPSASALRFLTARAGRREGSALVLGDPALAPVEGLPALRGARHEAATVARLLGAAPRLGPEASEGLIREEARGANIVHVAAHNVRSALGPRFGYLALAPDDSHDGKLEMREIHEELDLAGVGLVVLSACETAVGERTGGDEVVGLTRALLNAGAGAVMATLWSVDDDASAELATGFYRRLLAGERAAAALAGAQRELLAAEATAPPFYWAAFTLVGEPWQQGRGAAP